VFGEGGGGGERRTERNLGTGIEIKISVCIENQYCGFSSDRLWCCGFVSAVSFCGSILANSRGVGVWHQPVRGGRRGREMGGGSARERKRGMERERAKGREGG
jgi:hypothetical protein